MLALIGVYGIKLVNLNIDMNNFNKLNIKEGRAICYSGFRKGQYPNGIYPDYNEVKEDLLLLIKHWKYVRLYDCDAHAKTVLDVITNERLDIKVLLGVYLDAEFNNFNCPWHGGVYPQNQLDANILSNKTKISTLIELASQYKEHIFALSIGNETCVDWTDHYVAPSQIIKYVRDVKALINLPITYSDNYVPWLDSLEELANEVDFISIHSYPVWENKNIHESLDYTKENYYSVCHKYPDKAVIITEAGWTTHSNGNGINPENVNEEFQKIYFENLMHWVSKEKILTFYFEAFDEIWKGSHELLEPEKHWGLFDINRASKLAVKNLDYSLKHIVNSKY